ERAQQPEDLVQDDAAGQAGEDQRQHLMAAGEGQQFLEVHGGWGWERGRDCRTGGLGPLRTETTRLVVGWLAVHWTEQRVDTRLRLPPSRPLPRWGEGSRRSSEQIVPVRHSRGFQQTHVWSSGNDIVVQTFQRAGGTAIRLARSPAGRRCSTRSWFRR